MTGRTEERLRDASTALGQAIRPQDIPKIRLPEPVRRPYSRWRPSARWARSTWLIPVAAAAAVLAVIILLTMIGRVGMPPRPRPTPIGSVQGMPQYLLTDVGGEGYVRSTATGRVVASISPPARNFVLEGVAVAPGDRTFYLAGDVPIAPPHVRIEFFKLTIDVRGRPGTPQLLGTTLISLLPALHSSLAAIPLAISPDGTELAYASPELFGVNSGPASVTVQNTATGVRRSWVVPAAFGTSFGELSFGGENQLGFTAIMNNAVVSDGTVAPASGNDVSVFMVLNTAASGTGLIADSHLVAYGSLPIRSTTPRAPLPGPSDGFLSSDGRSAYVQLVFARGSRELVRMSVGTGKITEVLVRGGLGGRGQPSGIDGNLMLVSLPALHPRPPSGRYVCGDLAGIDLSTGAISRLPVPLYCSDTAPRLPFEAAW